jgi:hypothetical protein
MAACDCKMIDTATFSAVFEESVGMMLRNKAEEAFSSRTGERLTPEESCLIYVKITAPSTRLDITPVVSC